MDRRDGAGRDAVLTAVRLLREVSASHATGGIAAGNAAADSLMAGVSSVEAARDVAAALAVLVTCTPLTPLSGAGWEMLALELDWTWSS